MLNKLFQRHSLLFLIVGVSVPGYLLLGYVANREDNMAVLGLFCFLFAMYLIGIYLTNYRRGLIIAEEYDSHWVYTALPILLRLLLLFMLPNLSDDFYRFIWDGRLLAAGENPFGHLPSYYILNSNAPVITGINKSLFYQLNSPEYFTIYPPINQFVFWVAALLGGESILGTVVTMRIFLLASEIGTIWLLPKVLAQVNLKREYALIYTLNPLVIVEGIGNLHFEVMMFFFILLSLWWLKKEKLVLSAVAIALAVGTKLIPLIFLPFLPKPNSIKRLVTYYAVTGLTIVALFLPLLSHELISGLQNSVSLYYQKFEFNASIYFILREIGFQEYGYNRIAEIGKDLVNWTFWAILLLAYWPFGKSRQLPVLFMFALLIYFLLSTTVHPWYVITLLGLGTLTHYRFPIAWSGLIFLTYLGYSSEGFSLPNWVLFVEYGLVVIILSLELARNTDLRSLIPNKNG